MTSTTTTDRDEYLAWTPRTGQVVELYLDGTGKPKNFDRYVMVRDLGRYGLLARTRPSKHGDRVVALDAADLPELADEVLYALGELIEEQGGTKNTGPQVSLVAILKAVSTLDATTNPRS